MSRKFLFSCGQTFFPFASMGPRQKCLGNYHPATHHIEMMLRFNGAETKMSRKWVLSESESSGMIGFNGAETKMSRKYFTRIGAKLVSYIASMGPRQKCLGNQVVPNPAHTARHCFNGAETKMSRKYIHQGCPATPAACFNGAETKMSRKCWSHCKPA